jgi:PAS domain S-box-containing protein
MDIRVLVIDDDLELLDLMERFLVTDYPEFRVECATTAQDAIRMLELGSYDVIVSDYHLGAESMNGLELLEWLRDSGNQTPFVMFTGKSREEVAIRALNLGADFYLRKDDDSFQTLVSELGHHIQNSVNVRRMEDALAQSESRFQRLYDSSMDGILVTDIRGRVVHANERFAEMLGYDRDSLKGMEFQSLTPERWHELLTETGEEVQRSGRSRIVDVEVLTKDSRRLPVAVSSWRMDDERGNPVGAWVLVRDMSLSKLAEKALQKSEALFRSLFEDSPYAIAIFDSSGSLTSSNRCVRDMFGLPSSDAIRGYNLLDDPDLPGTAKASLRRGEQVRFEREYDFAAVAARGLYPTSRSDTALLEVIAAPFGLDEHGDVLGYTLMMREITTDRRAMQELETLRNRFKVVFDNTPVGLAFQSLSLDSAGKIGDFRILEANTAFERITGVGQDETEATSIEDVYSSICGPNQSWPDIFANVVQTSLPAFHEVYSQVHKRWYSLTIYSPAPDLCVSVLADITEQVKAYELLKRQKEELSEFAHQMKHDITAQLVKMDAYAQMLESGYSPKSLARLKHLITDVKDLLSHSVLLADAGLVIDDKVMTNLDEVSREAAREVLPASARFEQSALPEVMADKTKIAQVFRNLFENAVMHGGATIIQVSLNHTSDGVIIVVSNNGRRIPEESRQHLFKRGFSTLEGHRGLGLPIVRKLLEAHGWDIELADSDETAFEIRIPKELMYQ